MKRISVLFAVCFALASCGGGGGSAAVPGVQNSLPTTAPAATPTPATGLAPTSVPLKVSAYTATASVDRDDAHVTALAVPASGLVVPPVTMGPVRIFPVQSGTQPSFNARRPKAIDYPVDMGYFGGYVVGGTVSHNIYISTNYRSCNSTCWGTPGQFLTDLGASAFIHHLDQYIGLTASNRYTKGNSYGFTPQLIAAESGKNPVIAQDELMLFVYYTALSEGSGYGHIFHLFLHPGLDTCIDRSSSCYSPDNTKTFAFCAYHGSVNIGPNHYLYTVEPYQDVSGCGISGGPNAVNGDDLIDSTASTLSHEMFETITDPDGNAWYNPITYAEIGDPCRNFAYVANLNGTNYGIQSEYSTVDHGCIN